MILLQNKVNVDAPDATYPFGNMRDNPGDASGTPADTNFMSDMVQYFEKMFDESGLAANGLFDNDVNGFQLFEAMKTLYPLRYEVIDIGAWDMDATTTVVVPHTIPLITSIRTIDAQIVDDNGFHYSFNIGQSRTVGYIITSNQVDLSRELGGAFDSTSFNDPGVTNRGWVTLGYTY